MNNGWITLHRKLINSQVFKDPLALKLWVYLLLSANHKEGKHMVGNQVVIIPRGSNLTGRKSLSQATDIQESKIERLLKLFEKCGKVEQQTFTKYRLISITNYDTYQSVEQQVNSKRTASEQQVNTNNNVNNGNNVNKEQNKPSPKKVSGVPYQKIVDLYHEKLPTLPMIERLTEKRKGYIKQRWLQKDDLPDMNHWENFFDYVSQSKFLMGGSTPVNGHRVFTANLEWLTKESNFIKISEGNYHG